MRLAVKLYALTQPQKLPTVGGRLGGEVATACPLPSVSSACRGGDRASTRAWRQAEAVIACSVQRALAVCLSRHGASRHCRFPTLTHGGSSLS